MARRKTQEEFEKDLYEVVGNEYTQLDPYINNKTKIRFLHNKCGRIHESTPSDMLSGYGCQWCGNVRHYTTEEFAEVVRQELGDEFSVIGEYTLSTKPVMFRHNVCGTEFSRIPRPFLKKGKCPQCDPYTPKKKSHERFEKEFKLINPNLSLNSEYCGAHQSIDVHCDICGYEWSVLAFHLLNKNGYGCPSCSNRIKISLNDVKEKLLEKFGDEYEVLTIDSEYKNVRSEVEMLHKTCGNTFVIKPYNMINGKMKCTHCYNSRKLAHEVFIERVNNVNNNDITILGRFNGFDHSILCKCNVCGNKWAANPTSLSKGSNCPICATAIGGTKIRKTNEEFQNELQNSQKGKIITNEKYEVSTKKLNFICVECGLNFKTFPLSVSSGNSGCPSCSSSKGERRIRNYLFDNNISFCKYKKYDGLVGVGGGLLSYDFYLTGYNLLIEYQGQFHDGTVDFQTKEQFERQKEHDRRKREYAKLNNINLLEIWYWDFDNIESILTKYFLDNQAVA